jgi:hypothetical protein
MQMTFLQAAMEHILNKFSPLILIGFLLWTKFGLTSWEAYVILALVFFIQHYHFKLGYYSKALEIGDIPYEKKPEMEE